MKSMTYYCYKQSLHHNKDIANSKVKKTPHVYY